MPSMWEEFKRKLEDINPFGRAAQALEGDTAAKSAGKTASGKTAPLSPEEEALRKKQREAYLNKQKATPAESQERREKYGIDMKRPAK